MGSGLGWQRSTFLFLSNMPVFSKKHISVSSHLESKINVRLFEFFLVTQSLSQTTAPVFLRVSNSAKGSDIMMAGGRMMSKN